MSNWSEKIIYYAIGGICGIAISLILITFLSSTEIAYLKSDQTNLQIIISALIGMLVASNILQYKRDKNFVANKKIHDETVALITHEMRTGLTSTSWAIEVVLENYRNAINKEDQKMLDDVVKSINTTVMHSVNLLDISLLDIGKLKISLSSIKLEEVNRTFTELIEKYKVGAAQSGITLTSNIKLDPSRTVEVDLMRLRITLENILENSMQYTTREVKKIDVDITNDNSSILIRVSDTGIGIPSSERSKIFSEFYRASNARKMLSTGSGIGLHMSYEYVKAHHGTIRFDSKENEGTTFFISIPLKTSENVNEFLSKI